MGGGEEENLIEFRYKFIEMHAMAHYLRECVFHFRWKSNVINLILMKYDTQTIEIMENAPRIL